MAGISPERGARAARIGSGDAKSSVDRPAPPEPRPEPPNPSPAATAKPGSSRARTRATGEGRGSSLLPRGGDGRGPERAGLGARRARREKEGRWWCVERVVFLWCARGFRGEEATLSACLPASFSTWGFWGVRLKAKTRAVPFSTWGSRASRQPRNGAGSLAFAGVFSATRI